MNRLTLKSHSLLKRKNRIRKTVIGTTERPRLSVYISAQHVTAQIIDDSQSKTLLYVTTVGSKQASKNLTERATWVGTEISKQAKAKKIKSVVFDRNGRLYHGRIKACAEAARAGGMEF
jgi:large subunit ribosomal protein L18